MVEGPRQGRRGFLDIIQPRRPWKAGEGRGWLGTATEIERNREREESSGVRHRQAPADLSLFWGRFRGSRAELDDDC
jgi:hypothetical protein